MTTDITKNNLSDHALIDRINQTETVFGKEMTIPAQFILQAEKDPENIAIEDNGRSMDKTLKLMTWQLSLQTETLK